MFLLTLYRSVATFLTHCTNHSPWLDIHPLMNIKAHPLKLYFQPTMPNFVIYLPYLLTSFFLNKYSANISYRTLCWVNFIGMDQLISLYISSLQCSTCSACAGKGFVTLARGNQLIALYYYFLVAACIGLMCYLSSQTWEWTQAAAMTVSSPNH